MKKLLLTICLLLLTASPLAASQIPEKIILHNFPYLENWDMQEGQATQNVHQVKAKAAITLYTTPGNTQGPVLCILPAEQSALVISAQLHTFPPQNPFVLTRKVKAFEVDNPHIKIAPPARHDEIYFLADRGKGYFQAWWKGHIILLQPKYKVDVRGNELWLCIQHPETKLEGWTLINTEDWHTGDFSIFFTESNPL